MLHVTCGLPGSGKSTWAKTFAKDNGYIYLNTDDLTQTFYNTTYKPGFATGLFIDIIEQCHKKHDNVVVDACFINANTRDLLKKRFLNTAIQWHTFDVDVETCILRNNARERVVDEIVIRSMDKDVTFPYNEPLCERH